MFSNVKAGDKVLVSVPGKRSDMFETASTFFVPMTVDSYTPARFTVGGINYNKKRRVQLSIRARAVPTIRRKQGRNVKA